MSHDVRFPRTADGCNAPTAVDFSGLSSHGGNVSRCLELLNRLRPTGKGGAGSAVFSSSASAGSTATRVAGAQWGRFILQRQVGHGSYGLVYLATDGLMKREVVLKIPQPHVLADGQALKRFLREAEAAALLAHPNIVPVYEVGEEHGVPYIVSAYCRGASLSAWLAQEGRPIAPQTAAQVIESLAGALDYAHSRGVLHRDLKPANILLDDASVVSADSLPFVPKLTDFGLAKIAGIAATETCEGALVGTFPYMAPEQAAGRPQDTGVPTDIWALGAILYELLAGEKAFPGDDPSVLARIQHVEPRPLRSLRLRIPLDLINICQRCLQKEPADRYSTAHDLLLDLQRFRRGEPVLARPLNPAVRSLRWMRRRPAIAALVASVLLVAILGIAGIAWQWERASFAANVARQEASRAKSNLAQAHEALLDFAWLVQEFALYRRPEDPAPDDLWERVGAYSQRLREEDALSLTQRPILAAHSLFLANTLAIAGRHQEALPHFAQGVYLWRGIVLEEPRNMAYRRALALASYAYGFSLSKAGQSDSAHDILKQARQSFAEDLSASTQNTSSLLTYADAANTLGKSLQLRNRFSEALEAHREALTAAQDALSRSPDSEDAQYVVAKFAGEVGAMRARLGHRASALVEFALARDFAERLCSQSPAQEKYQVLKVELALQLAETQRRLKNVERASLAFQQAIDECTRGKETFSDKTAWSGRLAIVHAKFAKYKLLFKNYEAARMHFESANKLWVALDIQNALPDREAAAWGAACYDLARIYRREQRADQLKTAAQQGSEVLNRLREKMREGRDARLAREGCDSLLAEFEGRKRGHSTFIDTARGP